VYDRQLIDYKTVIYAQKALNRKYILVTGT